MQSQAQALKSLWKESLILGVSLAVLGGCVFFLDMGNDEYQNENVQLKKQVDTITTETNTLQDKFSKAQQNKWIYVEAMDQNARGGLSLNRQVLRDKFNLYNDQYYLSGLRLSMGGVEELRGAQYRRPNYAIIASDVNITFDAVSDEYVYDLIAAMQKELPGAMKVVKVSLVRTHDVTEDALRTITQKGTFPLVHCDMKLKWYGVQPVEGKKP